MTKKPSRKTNRSGPSKKPVVPPVRVPSPTPGSKSAANVTAVSPPAVREAVVPVSTTRWIGTGQLALRCGVSIQTIRNDIERGKILAQKTGTGRYIIPRTEADRYLLENGYAASSPN